MKINQRVETQYGLGTILAREAEEGALAQRFLVKLDNIPKKFQHLQDKYGGLYFHVKELKEIQV